MDVEIIVGLVGVAIAIATFFIGRTTAAHSSGREIGEIKSTLEHIKLDLKYFTREMKKEFSESKSELKNSIRREEESRIEADRRIHARIDEHIATFHSNKKEG